MEELVDAIGEIADKCISMEKNILNLSKENKNLKSHINNLESDLKTCRSRLPSALNSKNQSTSTDSLDIISQPTHSPSNPLNDVSYGINHQVPMRAHNLDKSCEEKTRIEENKGEQSEETNSARHVLDTPTRVVQQSDDTCELKTPKDNYCRLGWSPGSPVINRVASGLAKSTQKVKERLDYELVNKNRRETTVKPTPDQILNDIDIPERTTCLLVGDSIIKHIDVRRLGHRNDYLYKVYVPGMTNDILNRWLPKVHQNGNINSVIIHIGINRGQ